MLDTLIHGGVVVDGTGRPGQRADVGVKDGRIAKIGEVHPDGATTTIDATGLIITPGFIDVHTHYDAQLNWDGYATPSSLHGITTVFGGNCGFSLAPLKSGDADYTRRMMGQVEGMPLAALEAGADWSWETFGEFLGGFDGQIAVNAGFSVGHCALRMYVLGKDSLKRQSSPEELAAMASILHESIEAGALGFTTTQSNTHPDHNGRPVPSRQASVEEILGLCDVVGEHEGTSLEAIVSGCLTRFSDPEVELLAQMSARAGRVLNWNVLKVVGVHDEERIESQLRPSVRAREIGGRVVALTMPVHSDLNMSLGTYCGLWLIPGWREILTLPFNEKVAALKDPETRTRMVASACGTPFERLAQFSDYWIGDTVAPQNKPFESRIVADIAEELGVDPWDALVDIAAADDFATVLWPFPEANSDEDWEARRALWEREDIVIGGSDAGAHLDRVLGSPYPTRFLADTIRGRRLVSLERAVQLMTDVPAALYGLRDRGRVQEGSFADLVVFDPETVGSGPARRAYDLPGESLRLSAPSVGVAHVYVNGVETIRNGVPTGSLPGTVLRSGRDTRTVATR